MGGYEIDGGYIRQTTVKVKGEGDPEDGHRSPREKLYRQNARKLSLKDQYTIRSVKINRRGVAHEQTDNNKSNKRGGGQD